MNYNFNNITVILAGLGVLAEEIKIQVENK
jgi:hypothetical protein